MEQQQLPPTGRTYGLLQGIEKTIPYCNGNELFLQDTIKLQPLQNYGRAYQSSQEYTNEACRLVPNFQYLFGVLPGTNTILLEAFPTLNLKMLASSRKVPFVIILFIIVQVALAFLTLKIHFNYDHPVVECEDVGLHVSEEKEIVVDYLLNLSHVIRVKTKFVPFLSFSSRQKMAGFNPALYLLNACRKLYGELDYGSLLYVDKLLDMQYINEAALLQYVMENPLHYSIAPLEKIDHYVSPLDRSNPKQVFEYILAKGNKEAQIQSYLNVFIHLKQSTIPVDTNKLFAYHALQTLSNSISSTQSEFEGFLIQHNIKNDYIKYYKSCIDLLYRLKNELYMREALPVQNIDENESLLLLSIMETLLHKGLMEMKKEDIEFYKENFGFQ